jgi:light-harvesting protein B-800-850 alpha chain
MEGGMGMGMSMPEDLGPNYERRRMIDRLLAIADGATAVAAGGTDDTKAKLTELAASLRTVAEGSAADAASTEQVAAEVVKLSGNFNRMLASWAPAAGAASDDSALEEEFGAEAAAEKPAAEEADPAADGEAAPAGEDAAEPAADEPAAEAPAAAG